MGDGMMGKIPIVIFMSLKCGGKRGLEAALGQDMLLIL
jgi:hypothetical protein